MDQTFQIGAESLKLVLQLQNDVQALENEVLRLRDMAQKIVLLSENNPGNFEGWTDYYRYQYLEARRIAGGGLNVGL